MPKLDSKLVVTQSKIIFVGNPFRELTVGSIASTQIILVMVRPPKGFPMKMIFDWVMAILLSNLGICHVC